MGELINIKIAKVPKGTVKGGRTGGAASTAILHIENKDAEFAARAGYAHHAGDADHAAKADVAKEAERLTSGAISGLGDEFLSKKKSDSTPYDLGVRKMTAVQGFEIGRYLAGVSGGMLGIDKTDGQSFADVFKLWVRGKAYFETLTIIEAATLAGKQYITPGGAIKCTKVEEVKNTAGVVTAYRCYFLSEQDGEKTETKIIAGDQAISEMFNAKTGTTNKVSNHRYWRLVTSVNNDAYTDDAGNHYGYIDLSAMDCEADSDIPQSGDVIDHLGNRTDKTRQAAMIFSTVDPDSPSIKLLTGIDHYTLTGKDIISQGYEPVKGHAYMRCHGDMYIGDPDGSTFVKYDRDANHMDINAALSVNCLLGGQTFEQWLLGHGYTDDTALNQFIADYQNDIADIQTQIDGKAETWYQATDPSTVARPNGWLGESVAEHKGDLWYKTTDGTTWYWNGTAWERQDVPDSVFDAIDGKADIFVIKPTAYHKNDLWFLESDYVLAGNKWYDSGTLVVATQDSTVWNSAHWTKKDRYTDDTLAQEAIDSIADYEYLKTAIVDGASQAIGGLFLSSYIKLGTWNKSNPDKPVFDTPWSGLNGVYVNGRTPSYFAGGDMIDRFDAQDNMLNVAGRRYATSMVRMDGSAYFADGKVGFKKNGGGWLAGDNIRWDETGAITFGNGIKIDLGGGENTTLGGLESSIKSVDELLNKLSNLFIPYIDNSAKTWGEISDISTVTSVKVRTGIWTDSFVSARGLNGNGGGSGGGTGKSYLSDLLDVQLGALTAGQYLMWNGTKWVNSAFTTPDMTGYALESWVTANYQPKGSYVTLDTAQTITGAKTFGVSIRTNGQRGTWLSGKTAAAIMFNGGNAIDSTAAWYLYNMKSANGHVIAFGGLGDIIGFYTFLANRTENAYDSTLRCNLATGQWVTSHPFTANSFIKSGGTSSQFLKADGSVDGNSYLTTGTASSTYVKKSGDTMTGLLTANVGATHTGIKLGNTYLTAINGDTILQNNNAIRFGTDTWDYNQWAGLKYSHTAKTVYLGIADGSIFTANSAQSGGSILTPGISNIYVGNNNINKVWHAGNDGSGSGLDADLLDGVHASEFALGGTAYYVANDGTGARWIRIATFSHYVASGIITIENTWSHNANSALIFSFCVGYRGNDRYTLTQIGGTNALFTKARIVYPTDTSGTGFIEVYYDEGVAGHNVLYVRLTNAINATLIQTATSGAVPSTHAAYEQEFTACGMAARNIKASTFYGSLTGNASSATKLQTTRTIWGQSFNGTGNVSGNMTGVGNITASGLITNTGSLRLQSSASGAGGDVQAELWRGTNASWKFLNTGGMLKIQCNYTSAVGSYFDCMTLAYDTGNAYIKGKLDVAGTIKSTGNPGFMCETASNVRSYLRLKSGTVMYDIALYGDYLSGALQIRPKGAEANKIIITQGGDVGINLTGTNLPVTKLEVNGTTRINYLLTARAGVQIGDTYDYGWYLNSARLAAGQGAARGVNVGSLLVSNLWADATKVPANGIYSKGAVRIGDCTISWDSAHGMLKFDKGLYSEGGVSARGINANAGGGTGGGATSLSALTDVQLGTLTTGQYLKWNGAKWTNATIAMPSLAGYALESWVNANFLPYTALDDDGELGGTFLKTDGSNATSSTLPELSSWLPAFPTIAIADTDLFFVSRSSGGVMCGALAIWNYIRPKIQNGGFSIGTLATPVETMYVDSISSGTDSGELAISCAGNASQLTLYSNGNVGFGTVSKALYRLEVNGDAGFSGAVSATSYAQKSDARLKTVLGDAGIKVADIAAAPAVRFTWNKTGVVALGTTAQYWRTVAPELAPVLPDGTLGMNYGVAALLSAVSLARMTLDHEERIAELERENGELRQQIAELQTK